MAIRKTEESIYGLIERAMEASRAGDYLMAEQLLFQSYDCLDTESHHNANLRGKVFHLLANSYRNRGKFSLAKEFYKKAKDAVQNEPGTASLSLLDDLYIESLFDKDLELALASQTELREFLQNSNYHSLKIALRNFQRLAAIYWKQLQYDEAEKYLKEFFNLAEQHNQLEKRERFYTIFSLAILAYRLGKFAEAEGLYKTALREADELVSIISEDEKAELLNQLGLALCNQGKNAEAQEGCKLSAEIRERSGASANISGSLRSIADVYCEKTCFAEASRYCQAAMDTFELGGQDSGEESMILILKRLGLFDDAAILEQHLQASCAA